MTNSTFLSLLFLANAFPIARALFLNVTAVSARNNASILECWQLEPPFSVSTEPGTVGAAAALLGDVSNMSMIVMPANSDGGLHNAPHNQWVIFLQGLVYITLPEDPSTSAYTAGGEFGILFAADTASVSAKGHRTQYLGLTESVALQIPTSGGVIPEHFVLHDGPCIADEASGLRALAS
ncbi:hypothetical protein BX600DRAFT_503595 [Xylariales sp. PMI_506]|nr:hypothetical protein BX600DRAFT_503595 [Xylariales sp. PMI_506]